jgi:hypothetical protein
MASFPDLVAVLTQHSPSYNDAEDRINLRYTLDAPNSGYVGVHKFADFVEGFGPLKSCVDKVQFVECNNNMVVIFIDKSRVSESIWVKTQCKAFSTDF